jgi:hypothetical protein
MDKIEQRREDECDSGRDLPCLHGGASVVEESQREARTRHGLDLDSSTHPEYILGRECGGRDEGKEWREEEREGRGGRTVLVIQMKPFLPRITSMPQGRVT